MDNHVFSMDRITRMPMMALRGLTVYPGMLLNFDVERPGSVAALDKAMNDDQIIFLAAQKDLATDVPDVEDVYEIGTVCRVKQRMKQPGSKTIRVMVEGIVRAKAQRIYRTMDGFEALVEPVPDVTERKTAKSDALIRHCCNLFDDYIHASGHLAPEAIINILGSTNPAFVADFISQHVFLRPEIKQELLEERRATKRLTLLSKHLSREIEVLQLQHDLEEAAQERVNQQQQEYYLREQMKVIQNELGEGEDEDEDYGERIRALGLPEDSEKHLLKEVRRLKKQPFGSSEASVIRNYLDVCLDLPWNKLSRETVDIGKARRILDADHYGLQQVKERILEFLAVKKLMPGYAGQILCLVGPPGVGKTSVAFSIARCLNRKLARIALGGVHDEAEIRGHRKTYIGAMPGRIIAGIRQAGTKNPLLLLDEIDNMGTDYRGDPSSALLEVLDSEQNSTFRDHYLEIPFDLSQCMFITTANTTDTIPRALLDRMEVIELGSYTDEEKLMIAKNHLLPKQLSRHGLRKSQLRLSDDAIRAIIACYTRESGVRNLERELGRILRKAAMRFAAEEPPKRVSITGKNLEEFLGPRKFLPDKLPVGNTVGRATGLAWTAVGGETLEVEVNVVDGAGKLELTGNLGNVMKESVQAAMSYIRSRTAQLQIDPEFYKTKDIHVHFPEGAVPKDGPSAGITVCTAMVSALTGRPVRPDIAMTGEISIRGRVLPIGGLKEKTMAALRNGIHTIIIPRDNEKDLSEIDQTVRRALNFIPVDHVDTVLHCALELPVNETRESAGAPADCLAISIKEKPKKPGRGIRQ